MVAKVLIHKCCSCHFLGFSGRPWRQFWGEISCPISLNIGSRAKIKFKHWVKQRHVYTEFLANVSSETKSCWSNAKSAYETWLETGEGFCHSQPDAKLFRFGYKVGRLLTNFAKGMHPTAHITSSKAYQPKSARFWANTNETCICKIAWMGGTQRNDWGVPPCRGWRGERKKPWGPRLLSKKWNVPFPTLKLKRHLARVYYRVFFKVKRSHPPWLYYTTLFCKAHLSQNVWIHSGWQPLTTQFH